MAVARWGISNSHSITKELRVRAELKWDSWAHEQGVWVEVSGEAALSN